MIIGWIMNELLSYLKDRLLVIKKTSFLVLLTLRGMGKARAHTPYGVSESFVTVYESDKYIDNLSLLMVETGRNQYIEAARTVTVTT